MARTSDRQRLLDYWVGIPLVFLAAGLRRRRPVPPEAHNIGVLVPTAIGDLILDTGILMHLREAHPTATLHLFHGPTNAGVVPLLPVEVEAHCCDFKDVRGTLATIRRANLDIVVDLAPWPRLTALYAALSGAVTIGFRSERQHRHYAFDVSVPHLSTRHELENLRAIAEVFSPCAEYNIRLRSRLEATLPALPYNRLVLCHISPGGTRAQAKRWPEASWAELTRRLASDGYIVGFTGSPADAAAVSSVIAASGLPPQSVLSLCGKMSIFQLAAALKKSRLLITVDTGILHLASALNIRTIALHGPTRSARWGGRATNIVSLDAPHSQAGFIHLGFENNSGAGEIMQTLNVDTVYHTARTIVQRPEAAADTSLQHPPNSLNSSQLV